MTYQNPTLHYEDNADADESSSLFLTVADASPPSSLRQDGVAATKKKNGVPTMRTMIATCFLLVTIAVLYYGRGSSSRSSNTHRTDGTSAALLLGHNQAALVYYDPYYDPSQDYCFMEQYGDGKYCWYPTEDYISPVGTWTAVTGRGFDSCGPECPAPPPTPPPTTPVYDPRQDYCFKDNEINDKYCWYPKDSFPVGNWEGIGGRGYDNCGPKCTDVYMYDPTQDYCFADKRNADKYCWYYKDLRPYPSRQWKGEGGRGYDNCGPECTHVVGGQGLGKDGAKRHRKVIRDNIQGT